MLSTAQKAKQGLRSESRWDSPLDIPSTHKAGVISTLLSYPEVRHLVKARHLTSSSSVERQLGQICLDISLSLSAA